MKQVSLIAAVVFALAAAPAIAQDDDDFAIPAETEQTYLTKDYLIGGFPLRLDSNRKLLDNVASMAWNGLPLDYLDTWTAQVAKVTAAQVRDAMARKLQPDRMVTVIVGGAPPPTTVKPDGVPAAR